MSSCGVWGTSSDQQHVHAAVLYPSAHCSSPLTPDPTDLHPGLPCLQIMKRVEGILYAATQEEGHRLMQDAQQEFAGAVYDGEVDAQQGEPIAA
jgi:hypothetical protein